MKKNVVLIRNAQRYDFGGGERFPVFLAKVLQEQGYHPVVVSRSEAVRKFSVENQIEALKGWWWSHQNWSGARVLLTAIYVVWQAVLVLYYLAVFMKLQPLVVHIQSKDDFISGTIAAKIIGARVIWTDHADLKHVWQNVRIWYKNPTGKLVYFAALLADSITLVSKSEERLICQNISQKSRLLPKMRVIYNGAFDAKTGLVRGQKVIYASASRLVSDKGIRELIEAFLVVSGAHENCELWLIGDGRERETFVASARNHPAIKFLGQQADPLEYLRQSTVFVHPTYHEGFSMALVEASMLGLPIIATNVGGNPEIIVDHETGLLVTPKDTTSLQAAMELLYEDASLRQKLGQNARAEYEKRFNFRSIAVNEFIPLYEGVSL